MEDYYSDIPWGFSYFRETSRPYLTLALLMAGVKPPTISTACELAFGRGLTVNINAAADRSIEWFGTDFNADHAGMARSLAKASGHGAVLHGLPFSEFCVQEDLPGFDLIIVTGTWSWISDRDRRVLIRFLRDRLNPGGVFLVHYHTLPGALGNGQFRNLVLNCSDISEASGMAMAKMVPQLLDRLQEIIHLNTHYMRSHPDIDDWLSALRAKNPEHVAHEYFNRHWKPFRFAAMARLLAPAGLTFSASLNMTDHVDEVLLSGRQKAFLDGTEDAVFREATRDFFVNRSARLDCWIKSPEMLPDKERERLLRALRFVRIRPVNDDDFLFHGPVGEIELSRSEFEPVIDAMPLGKITPVETLLRHLPGGRDIGAVMKTLALLTGKRLIAPARPGDPRDDETASCRALNVALTELVSAGEEISALASPALAGAAVIAGDDQPFLSAWFAGLRQPSELAGSAGDWLNARDGRDAADHRMHARLADAEAFVSEKVPLLRALGII